MAEKDLRDAALDYHRYPTPGKISVTPTKAMATQRDLALAYSPGVADACMEIVRDPARGDEPDLARQPGGRHHQRHGGARPGQHRRAGRQAGDGRQGAACSRSSPASTSSTSNSTETDPDALIDTIARMEPTFGGINLEDIKAPECFYIEKKLRERMKIPVFHDDQHGTAIVAAAAILNALEACRQGHRRSEAGGLAAPAPRRWPAST